MSRKRKIIIKSKFDKSLMTTPSFMGVNLHDFTGISFVLFIISSFVSDLDNGFREAVIIIAGVALYVGSVFKNIYLPKDYFFILLRRVLLLKKKKIRRMNYGSK